MLSFFKTSTRDEISEIIMNKTGILICEVNNRNGKDVESTPLIVYDFEPGKYVKIYFSSNSPVLAGTEVEVWCISSVVGDGLRWKTKCA